MTWQKKTKANPTRGFVDDGDNVVAARRKTDQHKVTKLELMLGQVVNFSPVSSRNQLIKSSTSVDTIWQCIRGHFGFQSTDRHFVELCDIKLEPGERYQSVL